MKVELLQRQKAKTFYYYFKVLNNLNKPDSVVTIATLNPINYIKEFQEITGVKIQLEKRKDSKDTYIAKLI